MWIPSANWERSGLAVQRSERFGFLKPYAADNRRRDAMLPRLKRYDDGQLWLYTDD
jgi:hypothetical protein